MVMSALGAKSAAPLVLKGLVRLTSRILQALRAEPLSSYDHSSVLRLVNPVRAALAFACFVAGTVAFLRFFFLIPTLGKERIGQPPSKMQL